MKLEALWQAQSGEVGQIDQNAPETAPDDWTPGVSIHPLELRFAETPACETSELFVTVYNTHARDPLNIMSLTTDLSVFQPKHPRTTREAPFPRAAGSGSLLVSPREARAIRSGP